MLETKDGSERFTVTATEEQSLCVMFSPDSSTLLTAAGFSDPIIHLWDARSGEARGSLEGHSAYVTDLLFTPDGSRLISSGADQTIRLWDWTTRKPVGVLRGHLDEVGDCLGSGRPDLGQPLQGRIDLPLGPKQTYRASWIPNPPEPLEARGWHGSIHTRQPVHPGS